MGAARILTNVAVLLVAMAVWDDLRRSGRLTIAQRTWLLVAAIFALVSGLLSLSS